MADPSQLMFGKVRGAVLCKESMARHTALKVGGPAEFFVAPADVDDLRETLKVAQKAGLPHMVIGGGYNLLVKDGGFRGVVISLQNFTKLEPAGVRLTVGAGVRNGVAARYAADRGLTGLEFLAEIPGTVGGAIAMNAGAHGEEIGGRLESLVSLTDREVRKKEGDELQWGYRFLQLGAGEIVIEAQFLLQEGKPEEIAARMAVLLSQRRRAQKVEYPSAGSFFKNPEGEQAWRLIDRAGLRGFRIGGAQVAEAHANFLVNRGGACARDFVELAKLVREKVLQSSGINLEEEVRVIGED